MGLSVTARLKYRVSCGDDSDGEVERQVEVRRRFGSERVREREID